ncbi:jg19858 [Pararge aegeria aegeria]|uniref:Jg19858 protein n=1 Tax=Pararge aegeria aegeria TaxID=348720 RepID=A0A8S4QC25_9NEOP|nr:jg19858 [Pararge aegeria aegeria]
MSENRLKELRMKRTTLKGTITRVETFAKDPSLDSKGVELVEARRDMLILAFKAYEERQLDILVCDEKDREDISIVEDKYYSV